MTQRSGFVQKSGFTQKSFLSYLPPIFGSIKEFIAIGQVVDTFVAQAYSDIEEMNSGLFIESASKDWLAHHEKCYGIIPRPTETEESRRFRLLTLSAGKLPFTECNLKKTLDALCGTGAYTITNDSSACTLDVTLSLDSESSAELIDDMLRRMIPANLLLTVTVI